MMEIAGVEAALAASLLVAEDCDYEIDTWDDNICILRDKRLSGRRYVRIVFKLGKMYVYDNKGNMLGTTLREVDAAFTIMDIWNDFHLGKDKIAIVDVSDGSDDEWNEWLANNNSLAEGEGDDIYG